MYLYMRIHLYNVFCQIRALVHTIKNSSTIVLLQWHSILNELNLASRIIPRDVSTRWNSTFDMLDFEILYHEAIDTMTANHLLKLQQFELDNEEWEIAEQLQDTLRVWFIYF